jgi:hypothetical protein
MRTLAVGAIVLSLAGPSLAETVVFPTGSHPADVQAVQEAVNGGGTVLLKAINADGVPTAFDFGPPVSGSGWVQLTAAVEVRGEAAAGTRTTIRGGDTPFFGARPIRTAFRGIRFDRPRGAAIMLVASAGVEITDNVITGVVGFPWFEDNRKGQAVWLLGRPAGGAGPITGTVTIARNVIADIDAEDGLGLALVGFEADVTVAGNDIRGTNFMGILAFGHSGRVSIEDNVVVPGPERFPGIYSVGQGIQVGPLFAGQYEVPTAPAVIRRNRVSCENPIADGIALYGGDDRLENSVIAANRVTMHGSFFGGITLYDNVSYTAVALNKVNGSGAYALDVPTTFTPGTLQRGNVFLANDIGGFTEGVADVWLGESAVETWVVACRGTVLDEGINNHVVGCSPAQPGARAAAPIGRDLGRLLAREAAPGAEGLAVMARER